MEDVIVDVILVTDTVGDAIIWETVVFSVDAVLGDVIIWESVVFSVDAVVWETVVLSIDAVVVVPVGFWVSGGIVCVTPVGAILVVWAVENESV